METSSVTVPNASPSSASLCTDLYGMAVVVSDYVQAENCRICFSYTCTNTLLTLLYGGLCLLFFFRLATFSG